MKHQLSECKAGRIQKFGFNSILSMFFFKRVPRLSPRVDVPLHGVRDLAQRHWADAMQRLGGGRVANPYPADSFPWWWWQIVAIDDYPYAGIDFRGDPYMPLPLGSAYGDIGIESLPLFFLKKFELFHFFVFSWLYEIKMTCFWVTIHSDIYHLCADVGPWCPEEAVRADLMV